MEHKAFAFDWTAFERDLRPILERALVDNEEAPLRAFIETHRAELIDPYEGDPLPPEWEESLEAGDIQELADFALTRFYDPQEAHGVGYAWIRLDDMLPPPAAAALLGKAVGPVENLFGPGRMGSYFQSPAQVRQSLTALASISNPELADYRKLLERCAAEGCGLYVTF
jgi:hypothetical protein